MRHKSYNANTAFMDLLFNALLGFVALFCIALILIKEDTKKDTTVKKKAEFVINANWDSKLDHDVDLYIEDPEGNVVFFNSREIGLIHLERDDLGFSNDTLVTDDGTITYGENVEVSTIRGVAAGEYIVNVHLYRKNNQNEISTPVEVEVIKLNPYSVVVKKLVNLNRAGDEVTICRIVLNDAGEIISISDLPKEIVPSGYHEGNSGDEEYNGEYE
jgi:hypothetical protein